MVYCPAGSCASPRYVDPCPARLYHHTMDAAAEKRLESLRQLLTPVFRQTGVEKAILFGSYARNTQDGRSDLDLILIKNTTKRFIRRFEEVEALFDILPGTAVDVLIYTPRELERISHRPFIRKALCEGIVIYER